MAVAADDNDDDDDDQRKAIKKNISKWIKKHKSHFPENLPVPEDVASSVPAQSQQLLLDRQLVVDPDTAVDESSEESWEVLQSVSCEQIYSINPLPAKFFRGNINIYLHFVSFLHIDTTQVVEILPQIRQEPTYST